MAATIGIIGEGVTDQVVIRQILRGFTEDENLLTSPLQPGALKSQGGWHRVLNYCSKSIFKQAFTNPDFKAVIQIDTDWLLQDSNGASHGIPDVHTLSVAELVEVMRSLLIRKIGANFYEKFASRIVFAISVHQIECWLLGIYCDAETAGQIDNCEELLHREASKRGIKSRGKQTADFETVCKAFTGKEDLEKHSQYNESFSLFLTEVQEKLWFRSRLASAPFTISPAASPLPQSLDSTSSTAP